MTKEYLIEAARAVEAKLPDGARAFFPSWNDFCARLKQAAPLLQPDEHDQEWQNLYGIYQMGYADCLNQMRAVLQHIA